MSQKVSDQQLYIVLDIQLYRQVCKIIQNIIRYQKVILLNVLSKGYCVKRYLAYLMRIRKQNEVEAKNDFLIKLLHEALPPENVRFQCFVIEIKLFKSILIHGSILIPNCLAMINLRRILKVIQQLKKRKRSQRYFKN